MSPPLAVLLEVLAESRDAGDAFDRAWPGALFCAISRIEDLDEAVQWRHAIEGTMAAWRSSYEIRPVGRGERTLSLVADPTDREPIGTTPRCERDGCDEPLGGVPAAGPTKRFCSDNCRKRAGDGRRQLVAA